MNALFQLKKLPLRNSPSRGSMHDSKRSQIAEQRISISKLLAFKAAMDEASSSISKTWIHSRWKEEVEVMGLKYVGLSNLDG